MTPNFIECSVARDLTDEEIRTWKAICVHPGKPVSRESLGQARKVAATLPARMTRWEEMPTAQILADAAAIEEAYETLRLAVLHVGPKGLPHEPHVLAWKEWERVELPRIEREWGEMLRSIPDDAYARLQNLIDGLPRLRIEQEARSKNALKGAAASKASKPAVKAMEEIHTAWLELQVPGAPYPGDASFAKAVHARYAHVISNEGSIKNAISRWRREAREGGND